MLHLKNHQCINLPFFLLKSLSKMTTIAQRKLESNSSLYHHELVKILIMNELGKKGWDWNTFLVGRVMSWKPRARVLSPLVHHSLRRQVRGEASTLVDAATGSESDQNETLLQKTRSISCSATEPESAQRKGSKTLPRKDKGIMQDTSESGLGQLRRVEITSRDSDEEMAIEDASTDDR